MNFMFMSIFLKMFRVVKVDVGVPVHVVFDVNVGGIEKGIVNVTVNVGVGVHANVLLLRLFSTFMVMLTCIFNVHVDDSHVHVDIRVNVQWWCCVTVTENVLMWC